MSEWIRARVLRWLFPARYHPSATEISAAIRKIMAEIKF